MIQGCSDRSNWRCVSTCYILVLKLFSFDQNGISSKCSPMLTCYLYISCMLPRGQSRDCNINFPSIFFFCLQVSPPQLLFLVFNSLANFFLLMAFVVFLIVFMFSLLSIFFVVYSIIFSWHCFATYIKCFYFLQNTIHLQQPIFRSHQSQHLL